MIALACDHGGFSLMCEVKKILEDSGSQYEDFGTDSEKSCDYPVFAEKAARAISSGQCACGIFICGTGIGMSIVANKIPGIRAAVCSEPFSAEMTRRHNNTNVLCLGARVTGADLAFKIIEVFLNTEFDGGRHERRVNLIADLDRNK